MHAFFSCAINQSSWGYCNNYQNKYDDPCPTTVLNLTNLGQCKKFLMHLVIPVHYPGTGQMHLLYKLQSHKCSQCWFTDHKKFNMEPVWFLWVIKLEMDSALKRSFAFIQRKFLSWPVLCTEISLQHVHHWPNEKQRIMICFSLLWIGLIWITNIKIPQDVLKTISGHVVAKKWHVKNAVSTPILF